MTAGIRAAEQGEHGERPPAVLLAVCSCCRHMSSRLPSAFLPTSQPPNQVDGDGKVRTFGHERGQWVCHVYAEADEDVVSRVSDCLETSDSKSFKMISDPHFSLFRGNCVIRHHHIDLVVQGMQEKLSKLHSFSVPLKRIRTLQNDDCSRSFVCVCCEDGSSNIRLHRVLDAVKECLKDFTEVKDYDDEFIPHVSLLWFLNQDAAVNSAIQMLQQEFGEIPLMVKVTRVILKIGDRSYSIGMKNA